LRVNETGLTDAQRQSVNQRRESIAELSRHNKVCNQSTKRRE